MFLKKAGLGDRLAEVKYMLALINILSQTSASFSLGQQTLQLDSEPGMSSSICVSSRLHW